MNKPRIISIPTKKKIIFKHYLSPGDVAMLACAVRDLMLHHNDDFIVDVRTSAPEIFEGNPFITPLNENSPDVEIINAEYPLIHRSNQSPVHFIHGFRKFFEEKLNVIIPEGTFNNFVYIRNEEKSWYSAPREILGKDVPYWIVDAGYKTDFTCKQWEFKRWQELINSCPDITFVQVGLKHPDHIHPELNGKNLINLIGKTDLRQLIRLIYNSFGVLTPVSMPMVLAYGIPAHPRFKRKSRACIVLAGGREPNHWQQGPNQQMIHTCGMLGCCDYGGCWKSRVTPIGDNDKKDTDLCIYPTETKSGQIIPKCMDMIAVDDVRILINKYMENLQYE